jgi:copper chaperone CopZ
MKYAVHVRTKGFYCGACPKVVEKAVTSMDGVLDVISVRSLGLTSILYDAERIDRESICERIREAGFSAEIVSAGNLTSKGDSDGD